MKTRLKRRNENGISGGTDDPAEKKAPLRRQRMGNPPRRDGFPPAVLRMRAPGYGEPEVSRKEF